MTQKIWTYDLVLLALQPYVDELGRMPTSTEMRSRGNGGLVSAVTRHGGISKVAAALGASLGNRSRGKLTNKEARRQLLELYENLGHMPTWNELLSERASPLVHYINGQGGLRDTADKLGLTKKGSLTHTGQRWESAEAARFVGFGFDVERMGSTHPFDLRVNGWRVDVKSSILRRHGRCGTHRIYKFKLPNECDFFDCVCVGDDGRVAARFIIPKRMASNNIGIKKDLTGKYAKYINSEHLLTAERTER